MSQGTSFTFSSPAHQAERDYANDPQGLAVFNQYWNENLGRWTEQSIVGNPWTNRYDDKRDLYFNPVNTPIPEDKKVVVKPILWTGFPNRLLNFFSDPHMADYALKSIPQLWLDAAIQAKMPQSTRDLLALCYTLADGGNVIGLSPMAGVNIPGNLCPQIDWDGEYAPYTPGGSRGWLDEYCEWSIRYDSDGQIRQIMFTCENPAYWYTLWKQNPDTVLRLYQQYINPNVKREDLYLLGPHGKPVRDPLTGDYAYDVTNKWNSWTTTLPDRGGAMHLTSSPNTLSAEIYLAAGATVKREIGNDNPQALICASLYGRPFRNSDPHIGQVANQVVTSGHSISLTDPVGLYIQQPNFHLWSVNGQPDYDVSQFWQIKRGELGDGTPGFDSILHAVFTVPEGLSAKDIYVTDPTYGPLPLIWAGQIASQIKIALRATAIPPQTTQEARPPVELLLTKDAKDAQPWLQQFVPYDCYQAQSPIDLTPSVGQGTTVKMALVVQGGLENAQIEFDPPDGILPVTHVKYDASAYIFDLTVAADAPLGDRNVRVVNKENNIPPDGVPWMPRLLNIAPASG